jgi:hypothetical protein
MHSARCEKCVISCIAGIVVMYDECNRTLKSATAAGQRRKGS